MARLADQFRDDVHAAAGRPTAEGQRPGVWNWAPIARFDMRPTPDEITRAEERKGEETVSRESYNMPDGYTARWRRRCGKFPRWSA